MAPSSPLRRGILRAGLAAGSLFLPAPFALVWAQSEGAVRLMRLPKVALVVGNGAYRHVSRLRNTVNDARSVGAALQESGFEVTLVADATRADMLAAVQQHLRTLEARKCVGLLYFATHGLQLAWRNYLLPVDAAIARSEDVAAQSLDLGTITEGVKRAGNPMFTGDPMALTFAVDSALAPGSSVTDPLVAKIPTGSSPLGLFVPTWCCLRLATTVTMVISRWVRRR